MYKLLFLSKSKGLYSAGSGVITSSNIFDGFEDSEYGGPSGNLNLILYSPGP